MKTLFEIGKAFYWLFKVLYWVLVRKHDAFYELDLTGSRHSAKTKAIIKFAYLLLLSKRKVKAFSYRYTPKGAKESFGEFMDEGIDTFKLNPKQYNKTDRELKLRNGNNIRFMGFKSNEKKSVGALGIKRGTQADITLLILDEITEFKNPSMIEQIKQAIPLSDTLIIIRISNPWTVAHWYIKQDVEYHTYNKKVLKRKGYQLKSEWKARDHFKASSHSNHWANQFLTKRAHDVLKETWNIDPYMARVVDLGLPGVEKGATYHGTLLDKIGNPNSLALPEEYRAGIDWGESTRAGGSAVAVEIGRIGSNQSYLAYDNEYYHSNANDLRYKNTEVMAREAIEKIIHTMENQWHLPHVKKTGGVICYIDHAAVGIKAIFRQEAEKYKLGYLLEFKDCVKYEVQDRIRMVKYIMGTNRFFVNKTKCPMLWQQLQMSVIDETKLPEKEVRIKEDDDTLDAMEYFAHKDLLKFAKENMYNTLYGRGKI